jgi:hypothetical protein
LVGAFIHRWIPYHHIWKADGLNAGRLGWLDQTRFGWGIEVDPIDLADEVNTRGNLAIFGPGGGIAITQAGQSLNAGCSEVGYGEIGVERRGEDEWLSASVGHGECDR